MTILLNVNHDELANMEKAASPNTLRPFKEIMYGTEHDTSTVGKPFTLNQKYSILFVTFDVFYHSNASNFVV